MTNTSVPPPSGRVCHRLKPDAYSGKPIGGPADLFMCEVGDMATAVAFEADEPPANLPADVKICPTCYPKHAGPADA